VVAFAIIGGKVTSQARRLPVTKNERLARVIAQYWAQRGYVVKVTPSPEGLTSATINGAPLAPKTLKVKGKNNGR
jgi:hypothetical protein